MADRTSASWIATAHTASDQAETVLLRLGQGAGLRGIRGIHATRGRIMRPLLEVTRAEVEDFLASRGLVPLVDDPTNLDLSRARNRIRHRVLPELRLALGSGVDRGLVRFARHAREDEDALASLDTLPNPAPRALITAQAPSIQRRWARRWAEALGHTANSAELEALTQAISAGRAGRWEIGRRVELVVTRGEVGLRPALYASSSTGPARKEAVRRGSGYEGHEGAESE